MDDTETTVQSATDDGARTDQERAGAGAIDIEQLADRVYRLMVAEARLGRARGEVPPGPRRVER